MNLITASFFAGFLYIFSPGPIFMGMMSLVSHKGKRDVLRLASGAFSGDLLWLLLTYMFLIGASKIPQTFLFILNGACGAYLFYLAGKMMINLKQSKHAPVFEKPFREGLILGLLNPKSYPVAISIFSSLLYSHRGELNLNVLPFLMAAAAVGMALAYSAEIMLASIPQFRIFYRRHWKLFYAAFSFVFIGFGLNLWLALFRGHS